MTDIEKKALALLSEVRAERGRLTYSELSRETYDTEEALCRAIERHEAFRQEVSDAISELSSEYTSMGSYYADKLKRFIIAKPDPLVEAWMEAWPNDPLEAAEKETQALREALAKRGAKIVWEND